MYYHTIEFVIFTKEGETVYKTFSYGSKVASSSLDALKKVLDKRVKNATRFAHEGMLYADGADWISNVTDISVTKTDDLYEITGNLVYEDKKPGTISIRYPIFSTMHGELWEKKK